MDFGIYDWWWPIVWLLGAFLIPELIAAFDKKPGGTFTAWFRKVFALNSTTQRWKHLRRWSAGCFIASLGLHLIFQATVWVLVIYAIPAVGSVIYHYRKER